LYDPVPICLDSLQTAITGLRDPFQGGPPFLIFRSDLSFYSMTVTHCQVASSFGSARTQGPVAGIVDARGCHLSWGSVASTSSPQPAQVTSRLGSAAPRRHACGVTSHQVVFTWFLIDDAWYAVLASRTLVVARRLLRIVRNHTSAEKDLTLSQALAGRGLPLSA